MALYLVLLELISLSEKLKTDVQLTWWMPQSIAPEGTILYHHTMLSVSLLQEAVPEHSHHVWVIHSL